MPASKRCDATFVQKRRHSAVQTLLPGITGYATLMWNSQASIDDVPELKLELSSA
jgi:hypothetical protein